MWPSEVSNSPTWICATSGPGHYLAGRASKVALTQPWRNSGLVRAEVEPTGIAVERFETPRSRNARRPAMTPSLKAADGRMTARMLLSVAIEGKP